MGIKIMLRNVAEKLTGRKCSRCKYNHAGHCCHPDGRMFMKCWHSVTRPGFGKRPPRYLKTEDFTSVEELKEKAQQYLKEAGMQFPTIELTVADLQHIEAAELEQMTAEEQHQLQIIKASLQEAGDIASESGLLG